MMKAATVKFTDDGKRWFKGNIRDETFYSYLVNSFEYGTYWIGKQSCIILEYYD